MTEAVKNISNKVLSNSEDVRLFIRECILTLGLSFHPDTEFSDYVTIGTDEPLFSEEESIALERKLNKCWDICEAEHTDVYQIALDVYLQTTGRLNNPTFEKINFN